MFIVLLQVNRGLQNVNLSWNGFGFEGSVAIGDMLTMNSTLLSLDISSNRINPPAVMELMRGLTRNKVLQHLKVIEVTWRIQHRTGVQR